MFNQKVVPICVSEVARCRRLSMGPFFILLQGERYGEVPLPPKIPIDEFNLFLDKLDRDSLAQLQTWYRLDENAIPNSYVLQPRSGTFREKEKWMSQEQKLKALLQNIVNNTDWSEEKRIKYEASLTEQEAFEAIFRQPPDPQTVFCFFRKLVNIPSDSSYNDYLDTDPWAIKSRMEFENRIRSTLPNGICDYSVSIVDDQLDAEYLNKFCEDVFTHIQEAIQSRLDTLQNLTDVDLDIQQEFLNDQLRYFVGRETIISEVQNHIKQSFSSNNGLWQINSPLYIHGISGIGKTALMAQCIHLARSNFLEAQIFFRFIGVTPETTDSMLLLQNLTREICQRYNIAEKNADLDEDERRFVIKSFWEKVSEASQQKPVIILLDAINQLADSSPDKIKTWVPESLGKENVSLIVSTLTHTLNKSTNYIV